MKQKTKKEAEKQRSRKVEQSKEPGIQKNTPKRKKKNK